MRVKSEERRQAIIDVAREEFIKQGFTRTSMSGIAKTVGGSKATLYNYFSSKEEIFLAVMESTAAELRATAFQTLSTNKPLKETLGTFGYHYLKSILSADLTAIRKMALSEAEHSDVGRYFYHNGPRKGWLEVSHFLRSYIEQGKLRECDEWIAARQLKVLLEAELLEPYELGVIAAPSKNEIEAVVTRAVDTFALIYANC
ncbi:MULTISPECIES: TetR/AcrR family transcriptional regulator [Vibrio]|uniref:TetR/AcrR family transcriptional regulator n=1 Tax=Vibrio TaxID=662 RepID=UPI000B543BE7|nr:MULTISPECIES: TetR/AcrR family transcriptional regulator [Vibrio]ASG07801.1 TetR family transcriptional regulator [Vibrio anguillarum]NAW91373.1 TetR family transcriptional regulator [Vibrio sp. V24_P1S3T111]NNN67774.1 TetR/AcrR family transcriptional regulator [Vibrio sp. 3-2(1)]OXX21650.1 TetR family transcriptional regulator [Vibrio sp. V06_P1A73T115]OXX27165.1 TetR family transcriptional regulator [Vibrio sp. V05_P4A8T149]